MPPPLDRSAESQSAGHHSQDGSAANYSPGQGLAVAVPAVPATIAWGFDPVQGELLDAAVDLLQQGHQADGHAPLFDPDDVLELHVLWTLDNRPMPPLDRSDESTTTTAITTTTSTTTTTTNY